MLEKRDSLLFPYLHTFPLSHGRCGYWCHSHTAWPLDFEQHPFSSFFSAIPQGWGSVASETLSNYTQFCLYWLLSPEGFFSQIHRIFGTWDFLYSVLTLTWFSSGSISLSLTKLFCIHYSNSLGSFVTCMASQIDQKRLGTFSFSHLQCRLGRMCCAFKKYIYHCCICNENTLLCSVVLHSIALFNNPMSHIVMQGIALYQVMSKGR